MFSMMSAMFTALPTRRPASTAPMFRSIEPPGAGGGCHRFDRRGSRVRRYTLCLPEVSLRTLVALLPLVALACTDDAKTPSSGDSEDVLDGSLRGRVCDPSGYGWLSDA